MTAILACPCEILEHPKEIWNPAGRDRISYRVGDFDAFRAALLRARPDEVELANWRPAAGTDLALQMVEWWAYLADVLTFYNERIANQAFLRTADDPASVRGLVRLLGYRPRPGIGARGRLAALSASQRPITLPAGFAIQSKPGPGKQPQIFELDGTATVTPVGAFDVEAPPKPALLEGSSVLLKGAIGSVKPGDRLLLLPRAWPTSTSYALVTVAQVEPRKATRGGADTRITFTGTPALGGAQATAFRLVRSSQSAKLWPYATTTTVITDGLADLDSVRRDLRPGDPALIEVPSDASAARLLAVTATDESVFYANTETPGDPTVAPAAPKIPIGIPVTRIWYTSAGAAGLNAKRNEVIVRFGWQDVGQLIGWPAAEVALGGSPASLAATAASPAFPTGDRAVMLEDAIGSGVAAFGSVGASSPRTMALTGLPSPAVTLIPPLRVLSNLVGVSRGQSVAREILGSGDATLAAQVFVLKKSPLTYLFNPADDRPYSSTLRVWVDGAEWREVASFYAQPSDARIFVTREDDQAKTSVLFGDGVNGTRLPSGTDNVIASYRFGSGREAPDVGSLSVLVKPVPGLKSVRNPVPVGGGEDPDPPAQIRRYGPRSVLTFGRAVSADDYEVIAAQTPGVTRAKAYWVWDGTQQRTLVSLYVGDDANAVIAAKLALAKAADPNRPVKVSQARTLRARVTFTALVAADRQPPDVLDAVGAALLDADLGLFGLGSSRIGKRLYDSEIDDRCVAVPGVIAIYNLRFFADRGTGLSLEGGRWHDPGEGAYFALAASDLTATAEVASNVA
jgi:hypothetical protein